MHAMAFRLAHRGGVIWCSGATQPKPFFADGYQLKSIGRARSPRNQAQRSEPASEGAVLDFRQLLPKPCGERRRYDWTVLEFDDDELPLRSEISLPVVHSDVNAEVAAIFY